MHTAFVGKAFLRLVWVILVLSIVACGGGGGSGGSSTPSASKLFVADEANDAIGSVINGNPSPGSAIPVDRIIAGPSTGLQGSLAALALDAGRDQLYVSNEISITVFNNAGTASGDISPNRRVATIVGSGNFISLYLDTTRDILYVGDVPNGVRIYNSASTLNETGGPATLPNRTITGDFTGGAFSIRAVAVDEARDMLYVAVMFTGQPLIRVFHGASGLADGTHTPDRGFGPPGTSDMGMFVDSLNDRLYVSGSTGMIWVYDNAHLANGAVSPNRTINLNNSTFSLVTVDVANNRLYAMTPFLVYVINSVSSASGVITAAAAMAPPGSSLSAIAVRP